MSRGALALPAPEPDHYAAASPPSFAVASSTMPCSALTKCWLGQPERPRQITYLARRLLDRVDASGDESVRCESIADHEPHHQFAVRPSAEVPPSWGIGLRHLPVAIGQEQRLSTVKKGRRSALSVKAPSPSLSMLDSAGLTPRPRDYRWSAVPCGPATGVAKTWRKHEH